MDKLTRHCRYRLSPPERGRMNGKQAEGARRRYAGYPPPDPTRAMLP